MILHVYHEFNKIQRNTFGCIIAINDLATIQITTPNALIADHYLCPNISTKPMITPSHMCGVTQSGFQTYRRRHRVVVWPLIFIRLFRVKKSPISLSFKFWTVRLRPPLTNIYYCFGHQLPNYEPITEPRLPAHNPY